MAKKRLDSQHECHERRSWIHGARWFSYDEVRVLLRNAVNVEGDKLLNWSM